MGQLLTHSTAYGVCDIELLNTELELRAYGTLARQLVSTLAQWNSHQHGLAMPVHEIYSESRKGRNALRCYFQSQSSEYVLRCLERSKQARIQAETCELLAHLQFADWVRKRGQLYEQEWHAITADYEEMRSRVPRGQRPQLHEEMIEARQIIAVKPLDICLGPCDRRASASEKTDRKNCLQLLGKTQRTGNKVAHMLETYGEGILLMQAPVLNMMRLYGMSEKEFRELNADLQSSAWFGGFVRAVTAAFQAAVFNTAGGNNLTQPIEWLQRFALRPCEGTFREADAFSSHASSMRLQADSSGVD